MNSHHHQPLHYLPVRHYIRCGVVVTILTCTLALSAHASANNKTNLLVTPVMAATNSSPMETITVIYRNPFDYALYQQTTEILLSFNLELSQRIPLDAQQQSRQMAAEFGFPVAKSAKLTPNDKILLI